MSTNVFGPAPRNAIYEIKLHHNGKNWVMTIPGASQESLATVLLQEKITPAALNQQFLLIACEGGQRTHYQIACRHSGHLLSICNDKSASPGSTSATDPGARLVQWTAREAAASDASKFYVALGADWAPNYKGGGWVLVNKLSNMALCVDSSDGQTVRQGRAGSDSLFWELNALAEQMRLPKVATIEKMGDPPSLSGPSAPQSSEEWLTNQVLIPYYMVKSNMSPKDQIIQTPWYLLTRKQKWARCDHFSIPPGASRTRTVTSTVGMSKTSEEGITKTLDITVGADVSVAFGPVSGGVSVEVAKGLDVTQVNTVDQTHETVVSEEWVFSGAYYYALYRPTSEFQLFSSFGEPMGGWTVTDSRQPIYMSYPPDAPEPLST